MHITAQGPISEMTYTVSSGTLNSTIPYHWLFAGQCKSIANQWKLLYVYIFEAKWLFAWEMRLFNTNKILTKS